MILVSERNKIIMKIINSPAFGMAFEPHESILKINSNDRKVIHTAIGEVGFAKLDEASPEGVRTVLAVKNYNMSGGVKKLIVYAVPDSKDFKFTLKVFGKTALDFLVSFLTFDLKKFPYLENIKIKDFNADSLFNAVKKTSAGAIKRFGNP